MTHRHSHWMEKLQVQLTTVGAAVAAYVVIWPLIRPTDPTGPVVFFALGTAGKVGLLAGAACVLAAACCLTTVSVRPQGTLAAALLGLGGVSLHSGPMRQVLWLREQDLAALYWQMALEVLVLAAVAVAVAVVVRAVRKVVVGLAGTWGWRDLLGSLSETQQRDYLRSLGESDEKRPGQGLLGGGFARLIVEHLGLVESRRAGRRTPDSEVAVRYGLCFLACLLISVMVVSLLARSNDRGQVLFALAAGCFLASVIAYQLFPTRWPVAAWAAPVLTAVSYYVLAAVGQAGKGGPGAWTDIQPCYQALPIDWLTAGIGGSLAGFWVSLRVHEAKFLEVTQEQEQGA